MSAVDRKLHTGGATDGEVPPDLLKIWVYIFIQVWVEIVRVGWGSGRIVLVIRQYRKSQIPDLRLYATRCQVL